MPRSDPAAPVVLVTRVTPGAMDVPGVGVIIGPDQGFPTPESLRAFVAQHRPAVLVTMYYDRVDAALLDAAGPQLRGVVNFAVGFENIDRAECAKRGVAVCNTPDAVTEGTADLAFMLMLAAARRLPAADRYARSPEYPARGRLGMHDFLGVHLTGQTLLIVGAGRIGLGVAARSIGWGMRVEYVARTRHLEFEFAPIAGRRVELDEGLARADFVSIHTPLMPETRHLIDDRRLRLMKPTAVLVNTSRGPVVDEAALARAVREGRLFGAGLDVYEFEPAPLPDIIAETNIVMTPHIGSASRQHRELMTAMVSANCRAILAGATPPNLLR